MALEQLQEAVDRINAVLDNEQERLVAKGQQLGQVHWDRHQSRLESALLPGCKAYARISSKINSPAMAADLSRRLVAARRADIDGIPLRTLAGSASKAKQGNDER